MASHIDPMTYEELPGRVELPKGVYIFSNLERLSPEQTGRRFKPTSSAVRGHDLRHLLIVEFCDTADPASVYRKYSAMVVGDAVIPRHLYFGEDWVVKYAPDGDVKSAWIREESAYLEDNPHQGFIRDTFRLANLEYGRIDYSLLDGSPQVWETNTNPYLIRDRDFYAKGEGARLRFQDEFVRRISSALRSLDSGMEGRGALRYRSGAPALRGWPGSADRCASGCGRRS